PVKGVSLHVADAADKAARAEVKRAGVVVSAVARTRDWVNTAPNELRPPGFATQVVAAAQQTGRAVERLGEKALRRGGAGGRRVRRPPYASRPLGVRRRVPAWSCSATPPRARPRRSP